MTQRNETAQTPTYEAVMERRMQECRAYVDQFERAVTQLLLHYGATPEGLRDHLEEVMRNV